MAENIVEVTAGSGTKLHSWSRTIGANTVHDEFTLPGEFPYGSYVAVAESISIATANDHVLQIMAGASLNVRIRYIRIEQSANASAAANAGFQILRLTTAGTGGTTVTPARYDTSDSASGATAQTLPSSKGTESTLLDRCTLSMRASANPGTAEDVYEWTQKPGMKPIIIASGTSNGIALKSITAVTSASVHVHVEFVETAFV